MQVTDGDGWWAAAARKWAWRTSTWLLVSLLGATWFGFVLWFDHRMAQGAADTLGLREAVYALGIVAAQAVFGVVTLATATDPMVDDPDVTRGKLNQSVVFRLVMTVSALALGASLQRAGWVGDIFGLWLLYLPMTLPDVCRTIGLATRTRNRYPH